MSNRKRVTIREVADSAGVSTQTVSRVLNNRPDVAEHTRERIQAIIREIGYAPNVLARSLIRGQSQTIGVVGYGLSYYGPARVITGIQRRASELQYSLLLSLLREPETHSGEAELQQLLAHQVDGIIWAVPEVSDNRGWITQRAGQLDVPVIFINMQPVDGLAVLSVDNYLGGRLAAEHLLAQGYRKLGLITGPQTWWEARQRVQGWREALAAAGLSALEARGDWYPASGANGMTNLLRQQPDLEAVFACNDPMAAGALQAARRLGRRVPDDLALVGFDDVPEAAYYEPALTTIRQPLTELGALAVDLLIDRIGAAAAGALTLLQPQIIVRESSQRTP